MKALLVLAFSLFTCVAFTADTPPTIQWKCGKPYADGFVVTKQTGDGGYILAGDIYDARDHADFNILRLDANGGLLWQKTGGAYEVRYDDYVADITPVSGGGFVAFIESASGLASLDPNKTDGSFGNDDCWVIRLDADGNTLWDHTFGASGADHPVQIEQLPDNGYAFTAYFFDGTGGNRSSTNYGLVDWWFVRLDASGNKVFERSFGGTGEDSLTKFIRTSDGGFLLVGQSASPVSGNKTSPQYGQGDIWVVRLDGNGTKLWDWSYGGTEQDWAADVWETNGYFIVSGNSYSGSGGNKTNAAAGGWLFGLDQNGTKLWERAVAENECANAVEYPLLPRLDAARQSAANINNIGFQFALTGFPNLTYVIERSSDLTVWQPFKTNTLINSRVEIIDASATGLPRAFYRARAF